MKNTISIFLLLLLSGVMKAQDKQFTRVEQVWTGYFNQTRFSKHWGAWLDLQLRTKDDFFDGLSQLIIRPGITYYLADNTKLTAGYGYIRNYPTDGHTTVTQPEHRPWLQLQWHTRYGRIRTMQYIRLEERFRRKVLNDSTLGDGYNSNFRARYNFLVQYPLQRGEIRKGSLSLILNDEVLINLGKTIVNNYFDQNRFFAGIAFHTNASDQLQVGYLNIFQQLSSGNQYRVVNAARIFYFHNLDLRKK